MSIRQRGRKPKAAPESSPALQLNIELLLPWARGIARGVRADYGFRISSAEEEELEGVALIALVELWHRFDEARFPADGNLVDAFIAWAGDEVRSRCRRSAVQLRNGGTFRTTSDPDARKMCVADLPLTADGSDVALTWPEADEDDEPHEHVECKHEPRLVILRRASR